MAAIINSVVSLTATLVIGVDVQLSVGRFIYARGSGIHCWG